MVETVSKSLRLSCGSELTWQGISLPLDDYSYRRRSLGLQIIALNYRLTSFEQIILTFQHWAGVSPYTSTYVLAETCVFGKQLPGPIHCGSHCCDHPFSRSYGVILPSSLTIVLSLTLGYSPWPPVSVVGTGTYTINPRSFSWKFGVTTVHFVRRLHFPVTIQLISITDFPMYKPFRLDQNPITGCC